MLETLLVICRYYIPLFFGFRSLYKSSFVHLQQTLKMYLVLTALWILQWILRFIIASFYCNLLMILIYVVTLILLSQQAIQFYDRYIGPFFQIIIEQIQKIMFSERKGILKRSKDVKIIQSKSTIQEILLYFKKAFDPQYIKLL